MANCHDIFIRYNGIVKLSDGNRLTLRSARDFIRGRITTNFARATEHQKYGHEINFHTQGSYIMDTIITPLDDDFDLDDGVYFIGELPRDSRPSTEKFHDLVIALLSPINSTIAKIEDKTTCVRVKTDRNFHIDLPIYYAGDKNCPDLAHKAKNWTLSNPIEFIEWFENKAGSGFQKAYITESRFFSNYENWKQEIRKKDVQLRRLVRYLKAWADLKKGEMPSGIIMTILAANNFVLDDRDDISFTRTLEKILAVLEKEFICMRPTTPTNENLFADYSETKKIYFMTALRTFVTAAKQALESPNPKEACIKWQRHFGDRFPCQFARDEITGAKTYTAPAIVGASAESA